MTNKVVHFEIPADQVDRAQRFYQEAFGWRMSSMPGEGYTLVGTTPTDKDGMPTEPGGINGGMLARQDPIRNIVITVNVPDIDDALKRVEKSGGTVVRGKLPVGPIGFAAYIRDTEGNVVGLWQDAKK